MLDNPLKVMLWFLCSVCIYKPNLIRNTLVMSSSEKNTLLSKIYSVMLVISFLNKFLLYKGIFKKKRPLSNIKGDEITKSVLPICPLFLTKNKTDISILPNNFVLFKSSLEEIQHTYLNLVYCTFIYLYYLSLIYSQCFILSQNTVCI